jgi:hypothetical protein
MFLPASSGKKASPVTKETFLSMALKKRSLVLTPGRVSQ